MVAAVAGRQGQVTRQLSAECLVGGMWRLAHWLVELGSGVGDYGSVGLWDQLYCWPAGRWGQFLTLLEAGSEVS